MNHITIMGRLTADPEVKSTQSGISVVSINVAVERDYADKETKKRETDFIHVTAWRNTADFIGKYFSKGRMILVEGSLQQRNFEDKQGNKRTSYEVLAEKVHFTGESKKPDSVDSPNPSAAKQAPSKASVPQQKAPQTGFPSNFDPDEFEEFDEGVLPY